MRKNVIVLFLAFSFFCSCNYKYELLDLNEEFELSEELELYLSKIEKICIYMIDRSLYSTFGDVEEWPLYTEKEIKQDGDLFIFKMTSSQQGHFIAILLYNAKPVDISLNENVLQTIKRDGLVWVRNTGWVIDVYDEDDNIIKTYIGQNKLDVFYEKDIENVFYEMPKILLDKFNISNKEFLFAYKKSIRNSNHLIRQTQ